MSEIKDYGEPWAYHHLGHADMGSPMDEYRDRVGNVLHEEYGADIIWDHMVACVNALAGRNPAKLDALVEAVRGAINDSVFAGSCTEVGTPAIDNLRAALAAFEGVSK